MSEEMSEGGITTPVGSVNFKGKNVAEFIAILCLALLFLMGYVIWEHKEDSKKTQDAFIGGLKDMAMVQRDGNSIAREQLCLLAMPQEKREREFTSESSFCKRLSRER